MGRRGGCKGQAARVPLASVTSPSQGLPQFFMKDHFFFHFQPSVWWFFQVVPGPSSGEGTDKRGENCWIISLKNAARFVTSIIQHPGATGSRQKMLLMQNTLFCAVSEQERVIPQEKKPKHFGIVQKCLYVFPKAARKNRWSDPGWGKEGRDLFMLRQRGRVD